MINQKNLENLNSESLKELQPYKSTKKVQRR